MGQTHGFAPTVGRTGVSARNHPHPDLLPQGEKGYSKEEAKILVELKL
jgi:hypothetical protein